MDNADTQSSATLHHETPPICIPDRVEVLSPNQVDLLTPEQGKTRNRISRRLKSEQREDCSIPTRIISLESREITSTLITQISDLYRETFNKSGHFLYFPISEKFVSPAQALKKDPSEVTLESMDELKDLPIDPETMEKAILFHDPIVTEAQLAERLAENGFLTYIENPTTGEILGFTFGFGTTLKRAFELEWEDPLIYSSNSGQGEKRSFEDFLEHVKPVMQEELEEEGQERIAIGPETEVFVSNCVITSPKIQGTGKLPQMMQAYQSSIPIHFREMIVIGECKIGIKFHRILEKAGNVTVKGFLPEPLVLMVGYHNTSISNFGLNQQQFGRRKRRTSRGLPKKGQKKLQSASH